MAVLWVHTWRGGTQPVHTQGSKPWARGCTNSPHGQFLNCISHAAAGSMRGGGRGVNGVLLGALSWMQGSLTPARRSPNQAPRARENWRCQH